LEQSRPLRDLQAGLHRVKVFIQVTALVDSRYPNTDPDEVDAITTLRVLVDSRKVKLHLQERDKTPNWDGYVELVDANQVPVGMFLAQVKKIPRGQTWYDCPSSLVGSSKAHSMPAILLCADVGGEKVFWRHISERTPEYKPNSTTFRIRFTQPYDVVDSGESYFNHWCELCRGYIECISAHLPEIFEPVNEAKIEAHPLGDPNLYRFLAHYYREQGANLLTIWGHPFPLVGWSFVENLPKASDVLVFEKPGQCPGPFAFKDDSAVQRRGTASRDLPTFCLRRIEPERSKIVGGLVGKYCDGLRTCDALEDELLDAWMSRCPDETQFAEFAESLRHRRAVTEACRAQGVSPILDGFGRNTSIAISTVTAFRYEVHKLKCFFMRRSSSVAVHPRMYHVVPSGMFQPMKHLVLGEEDEAEPEFNLTRHLYREFLEEVFSYTDPDMYALGWNGICTTPEIRYLESLLRPPDGAPAKAELFITGVVVNLLNLRPEICSLLLIHDSDWYDRCANGQGGLRKLTPNIEFDDESGQDQVHGRTLGRITLSEDGVVKTPQVIAKQVRDGIDPSTTVAAGAAALWYGVDTLCRLRLAE